MALRHTTIAVSFVSLLALSAPAAADVWDTASESDDTNATDNVLMHTASPQVHDLGVRPGPVADQDWYRVDVLARRSYELLVFNVTADLNFNALPNNVARVTSGGTVVQGSTAAGPTELFTRALRWIETTDGSQFVRVQTTSTALTTSDQYTVQLRETTLYCPRYNNTNGQISVLILFGVHSNPGASCTAEATYFSETAGAILATDSYNLEREDVDVISLPGVAGLANQKGAAQIAHTCGVGGLQGKLVALEPATGFSFDTPCTERAR